MPSGAGRRSKTCRTILNYVRERPLFARSGLHGPHSAYRLGVFGVGRLGGRFFFGTGDPVQALTLSANADEARVEHCKL